MFFARTLALAMAATAVSANTWSAVLYTGNDCDSGSSVTVSGSGSISCTTIPWYWALTQVYSIEFSSVISSGDCHLYAYNDAGCTVPPAEVDETVTKSYCLNTLDDGWSAYKVVCSS